MERGVAVRPAGAPMVPMQRPTANGNGNGDGSTTAVAGTVAAEARETGRQVAQEATQATRQVAGEARRAAGQELDRRSTVAGERVGTAAQDARDIAATLRGKGREGPAQIADRAAARMDDVAGYLRDSDGERLMTDARRFVRQKPAVVVGTAAVVGIMLGRILKASEPTGAGKGTAR